MRRATQKALATAFLLLVGSAVARTQEAQRAVAPRSPVSVFIAAGQNALPGGDRRGGAFGIGIFGFAYEHPGTGAGAWRLELLTALGVADLGRTGLFSQPTYVSAVHVGLGAGYRRYAASGRYLGGGAALLAVTQCDVDFEGGPGFLGGETESCLVSGFDLRSKSGLAALHLAAGLRAERFDYELRLDQGITPSLDSPAGAMRLRSIGLVLHYRFRSRR